MGKSISIYVWDNIENIIHRIESQIYFKSHTKNYKTWNTFQRNMKTVHFNMKIVS